MVKSVIISDNVILLITGWFGIDWLKCVLFPNISRHFYYCPLDGFKGKILKIEKNHI